MPAIASALDAILSPQSIAVIGASATYGKWGHRLVERPLQTGFKGPIYPVNPRLQSVLGLKAYPSVKEIPGPVDLAIISVHARDVPGAMQECADKKVKGAVIISAGFAETGQEGRELEEQTLRIARSAGIRFVGPNCMGLWSSAGLNLCFSSPPSAGRISFISQSGTFGIYMVEMANARGIGLRTFVSIGNQADLTLADYIEYLAGDDQTGAIILYIEGVKDGRRFIEACRQALRKKPIILFKGGSSAAGERATMSHTGSIAGSEVVFDAVCRQLGLIRTHEPFDTFEMARALLGQPLPPGRRVGILGTGGQGVVSVDDCQHLGLDVPELNAETSAQIMKLLPPHAPLPRNPVDFAGAFHQASEDAQVVEKLMQQENIDGVISSVPYNPLHTGEARWVEMGGTDLVKMIKEHVEKGTEAFAALPAKYGKPIVCLRYHPDPSSDLVSQKLAAAGIPVYDAPGEAAKAMYALARYAEVRRSKYPS